MDTELDLKSASAKSGAELQILFCENEEHLVSSSYCKRGCLNYFAVEHLLTSRTGIIHAHVKIYEWYTHINITVDYQ